MDVDYFSDEEIQRRKAEEGIKKRQEQADSEARKAAKEKFSCTTCLAFEPKDTLEYGDELPFSLVTSGAIGICRLRPPTPAIAGDDLYPTGRHDMQPVVTRHTWCLQHQPIPKSGDDGGKP